MKRGTATVRIAGVLALGLVLASPATAQASPRDNMREAYATALDQFNNLDYPAADAAIEAGIQAAEAEGAGSDPVLASLYVLRAALLYSNEGEGAQARIVEAMKRAAALNYHVVVPLEVRSDELQAYLDQARQTVSGPSDAITHQYPEPACGGDLVFEALLGVPDGGQAALYWRKAGEGEFTSAAMDTFSNVAVAVIPADEHEDADIEYFIYAFDASNNPVANLGLQEDPRVLPQNCAPIVVPEGPTDDGEDVSEEEPEVSDKSPKETDAGALPKVWINIGLGTGLGIARGRVEQTYWQFRPNEADFLYGDAEAACAISRWLGDGENLADPSLLYDPMNPTLAFAVYGPAGRAADLATAYDVDKCAERHPVTTGIASAPFHIAPEVAFRIGKRISLGVFTRLQVVTGSKVISEHAGNNPGDPGAVNPNLDPADPDMQAGTSYWSNVYSESPEGQRLKHKFTWALGVKFRYFLGKDEKKFRPYVGGFAGYGQSRLRVNLNFGQDANGNSVPDSEEIAADATDAAGSNCVGVWPYNVACNSLTGGDDRMENLKAQTVQSNASGDRIDTVVIGPGFLGALVGFNMQIVKNFALFAEVHAGGWFPSTGSALFDLNVGPAITF